MGVYSVVRPLASADEGGFSCRSKCPSGARAAFSTPFSAFSFPSSLLMLLDGTFYASLPHQNRCHSVSTARSEPQLRKVPSTPLCGPTLAKNPSSLAAQAADEDCR